MAGILVFEADTDVNGTAAWIRDCSMNQSTAVQMLVSYYLPV